LEQVNQTTIHQTTDQTTKLAREAIATNGNESRSGDDVKRHFPILTANQARVLGTLMEKARTVPDSYPLTVNSLI
jgi:Protein of unknown function, DUF480